MHRSRLATTAVLTPTLVVLTATAALAAKAPKTSPTATTTTTTTTAAPAPTTTAPATSGDPVTASTVACPEIPGQTTHVSTADELKAALANEAPGSVIVLADGVYSGNFESLVGGTAALPVVICGSHNAVLDGTRNDVGIVLHVVNAPYTNVLGITLRDARKGIVIDNSSHSIVDSVTVHNTGQEGIHLLKQTVDGIVRNNMVYDTGKTISEYGEGIYVGTANSNWCSLNNCQPDTSDNVQVLNNTLGPNITAEEIDIKEGTNNGLVSGNVLDGTGMLSARSWVDVKGNGYTLTNNIGRHTARYGFTDSQVLAGWGNNNTFTLNTVYVPTSSAGFHVATGTVGVVVKSNTTFIGL